jgi:hypothetical protein
MNMLPLFRATVGAVLALALGAAPAVASVTDGTSNTLSVAGAPNALSLNYTKITDVTRFQGGCSNTSDTCLMETEGIYPPSA